MGKKYQFQKLTPSDDVEMGIYRRAMEYVFANDDIRNIAISGAYGAGKSSMLESYKKVCPEKKFMHISLAHFVPKDGGNTRNFDTGEDRVATLEGKIINQLVYQIDPQKIPQTHFKIKKNVDKKHILKVSLLVTIFIAITCFLRFKGAWENMVNGFSNRCLSGFLSFTNINEIEFLLGAFALVILWRMIYEMVKLQKSAKLLRKLSFQGNEIEIFEESKDSYFDKYLNEVLYIFDHTEVDGIVFEDIDRYDTNLLFEKLREINFLLNQSRRADTEKRQRKTMRFFYLLRDDIFESKDRTKFFDFILPIVPVIDASNAYEKFIEYFNRANLLELFDMEFLQELSLYVDDMRVLKNICNEFVVYHARLKSSFAELNDNKLLAMITYKNIFPKDFGNLQAGRGYVHTLFAEKKKFIRSEREKLKKEIDRLQKENERMKADMCNDLDELNSVYFVINGDILVDGKREEEYKTRKEFVKAILTSSNIQKYSYGSWSQVKIDNEKKVMENNSEYIERKQLIEKKNNPKVNRNNYQLNHLKEQQEELAYGYLKNLITRENEAEIFATNHVNAIDEVDAFKEVKRSPYYDLIKYLIRNGYIDETYPDYMTYFYPNRITANDKAFLRSVADRHAKPYDYKLDNANLVISRMRIIDFKEEEAFNFQLLQQLLSDTSQYQVQLTNFLYAIWNFEPAEFVSLFLDRNIHRKIFVQELNKAWTRACYWVITEEGFRIENRRRYIADTLCICSDDTISQNNQEQEIKTFVENDPDFIAQEDIDVDILKNKFKFLGVVFKDIHFDTANKELLQFVYDNNMYELNMEMVYKVLIHFCYIEEKDYVLSKSLSIILSKKEEPLCGYVINNLDIYIHNLLAVAEETEDLEEVVVFVLNNIDVTDQNKKAYLESTKTTISQLEEINDKRWFADLLELEKVEKTGQNLCDYYYLSDFRMDERLVQYINSFKNNPVLETADLDKTYGEGETQRLFEDLINCNGIDNDKYEAMVCAFHSRCAGLKGNEVTLDKIEILVDHGILEMNADTLVIMREHYPEICIPYIVKNIEKYVDIVNAKIFSPSELMQLLGMDIDEKLKIKLLHLQTKPISIRNMGYSVGVEDYIVENLFCADDLGYLVRWYPENRKKMRSLILSLAIEALEEGKPIPVALCPEFFESLIQSDQLDVSIKIMLLAQQIALGMRKANVRNALEQLKLGAFALLLNGSPSKVQVTEENEAMLETMRQRKWISSYEKDESNSIYQVHVKAARKTKIK